MQVDVGVGEGRGGEGDVLTCSYTCIGNKLHLQRKRAVVWCSCPPLPCLPD